MRHRLIGPVMGGSFETLLHAVVFCSARATFGAGRPGKSRPHPALEDGDLLILQLPVGRHLETIVVHRLEQQALPGRFQIDRRPRVAASQDIFARNKRQTASQRFFLSVAFQAVLAQEGSDLGLEETSQSRILTSRVGSDGIESRFRLGLWRLST